MKFIKILFIALTFSLNFSVSSYANQSVEEIIKGRKAIFSKNYQTAKKISILLKSKKIEEAKPLMQEMSDNYKKLLNYFPENTKEGFKTEALPTIWENSDEFVTLMQKASFDMIQLTKAIDTAEDLRAIQKKLMWSNCSACHNRFRAEHQVMELELVPLILFGIAAGFSPGPNNIVTSYSAFNFGFINLPVSIE